MMKYLSLKKIAEEAVKQNISIGEYVLEDQAKQMEISKDKILENMDKQLSVMEQAAEKGSSADIRSTSGLTGGDAFRMLSYIDEKTSISGAFCSKAMATAIAVAECNAAMGRILASPTAGSCGILPGALLPMMKEKKAKRQDAVMGLICAGGIGMVIANKASLSGAAGGCQAECGSAAAMAAGALVEMNGGTPDMVLHAVAIALKNQMGLVCDPVAGLVEVPCIKRNASGVMIAITAADMALAGIKSVIPADEVIEAMGEVGDSMPCALRETAQGGIAATPTAKELTRKIFKEHT